MKIEKIVQLAATETDKDSAPRYHITLAAPAEAPAANRFGGIAYSGEIIPSYGWIGDVVIDLADAQIPDSLFALVNHDPDQRVGKCRPRIENGQLWIEGEFLQATDIGRQVAAELAEGAPWQYSIGFTAPLDIYNEAREVTVNGRTLRVQGIFRAPRLLEVSFVPAGADPKTVAMQLAAGSDTESALALLTAERDGLRAQVTELTAANDDLRRQLRRRDVIALYTECGLKAGDIQMDPFQQMDEAAWVQFAADLRKTLADRPAAVHRPPYLFQAQQPAPPPASDGPPSAALNPTRIYQARRAR
jgi:phage head maturation protease